MLGAKQVTGFDLKKHLDKEKFTDINDVKEDEDEESEEDLMKDELEDDPELEEEKEELDENLLNMD